jgi:hypothetical protein
MAMIANGRIRRSVGAGIAGTMISAYAATARFSQLSRNLSVVASRQSAAWDTNVKLTTAQALAGTAVFGSVLGLGYVPVTRLIGRRGIAPGAAYGIAFWLAFEAFARLAPQAAQRWQHPPSQAIPRFAILGASIGAAADRRLL